MSQKSKSGTASPQIDPLREAYKKLKEAESLRLTDKSERAREICEDLVRRYPDYFGALYTLGLIYIEKMQFPQALGCLVRAAMLNPLSWRALTALSAVYLELGASEMAANALEQASQIEPEEASILLTLGEIYRKEREYELARDAYSKSFALDNSLEVSALGLGASHEQLGQYQEAAEIFEKILNRGRRSIALLSEFTSLPPSFVNVDVLALLKEVKKNPGDSIDSFENMVAFVSGAALDREDRHGEAWQHLEKANEKIHLTRIKAAKSLAKTQKLNIQQLKKKNLQIKGDSSEAGGTKSLFILGPSRSGKTTLETLVSSLEGVKRGYENPCVENAVRRTFQSAGLLTAIMFEVLPPNLNQQCCDIYLKELSQRAGSAKVFTNTHPARIHDAARVAVAFPNVRFLFVKRNIEDNMLRIYMRKYRTGNSYGYDLNTIRDHINWYHDMIDLLAAKLPDISRIVHYEDMISDPSAALNTAAELCELNASNTPVPMLGDDRGCAKPYLKFMKSTLKTEN